MHTYLSAAAAAAVSPLTVAWIAGGFTLAGVVVSQVITVMLQWQARRAASRTQVETVTAELAAAVFDFRQALVVHNARWNALRPRLMRVGLSALELLAARATGAYQEGMVRAARVTLDWGDSETAAAAVLLGAPFGRVTAALARAALLPDRVVGDALEPLGDALSAVMTAYGDNAMHRKKSAAAARAKADAEMQRALGNVMAAARAYLHPTPRWRRWARRIASTVRRPAP
jgi:hypothetical protein